MHTLAVWLPGHFFGCRCCEPANKKQQPYKHENILFGQNHVSQPGKSPNSKEPIKTVLKTASQQFRGGFLPNVVQTANATKRKPKKTVQL